MATDNKNIISDNSCIKLELMIIDDEEEILNSLQELLKKKYKIIVCNNPLDAFEKFKVNRPHLVISDQRMPDLDGISLIEKIKSVEPSAMCILLTGYSDIDVVIQAVNKGLLYKYINKPWKNSELVELIDKAARKYCVDNGMVGLEYNIYF